MGRTGRYADRCASALSSQLAAARQHPAGCPSGQRERSVKPSAMPTLVRTQYLPQHYKRPLTCANRSGAVVVRCPAASCQGRVFTGVHGVFAVALRTFAGARRPVAAASAAMTWDGVPAGVVHRQPAPSPLALAASARRYSALDRADVASRPLNERHCAHALDRRGLVGSAAATLVAVVSEKPNVSDRGMSGGKGRGGGCRRRPPGRTRRGVDRRRRRPAHPGHEHTPGPGPEPQRPEPPQAGRCFAAVASPATYNPFVISGPLSSRPIGQTSPTHQGRHE